MAANEGASGGSTAIAVDPEQWDWYTRDYPRFASDGFLRRHHGLADYLRGHDSYAPTFYLAVSALVGLVAAFLLGRWLPWLWLVAVLLLILAVTTIVLRVSAQSTFPIEVWGPPERRIFGTPGSVAEAADIFGVAAAEAGAEGERRTAELLKHLVRIPGTCVFHGLKFPGSDTADVDHAVLQGHKLFLIDSKLYRGGTYRWETDEEGEDLIVRKDWQADARINHMADAATGYRSKTFSTEVVPVVIIHGRLGTPGEVTIEGDVKSALGTLLLTPETLMERLGGFLSEQVDDPAWEDWFPTRSTLTAMTKRPLPPTVAARRAEAAKEATSGLNALEHGPAAPAAEAPLA